MENGEIPDEFISSSSISDNQERAAYGRLNFTPKNGLGGAWSALRNDMNQWLQVQFHDIEIVSKVATQGRQNAKQFVREYYLSYSLLGDLFKHYNKKEVTGKWKPYITSYFQQGKIKYFRKVQVSPVQNENLRKGPFHFEGCIGKIWEKFYSTLK